MVSGGFGIFAVGQQRQTEERADENQSLVWAFQAREAINTNYPLALRLTLESVQIDNPPVLAESIFREIVHNVELDMGEGPDHSIYDVYVDGTLWQSFDGYAGTAATRTIDIPLRGDGWHTLQLRNRHEQNLQSSGYKLRFKELRSETALTEQTINYSYDSLSRLLTADYDNGATVYNYGYDEAGNMTYMNGTTRTYNAANQMTNDGTNTLTYDNNGNLTAVGANSYTWDRANRLLSHGGISYAYDGAGNRISQDTLKYLLDVQPGLTVVLGDSDDNHFVHGIRGCTV